MKNKFIKNNLLALTFIIASTFTGCGQSSESTNAEISNQTEESTQCESKKYKVLLYKGCFNIWSAINPSFINRMVETRFR